MSRARLSSCLTKGLRHSALIEGAALQRPQSSGIPAPTGARVGRQERPVISAEAFSRHGCAMSVRASRGRGPARRPKSGHARRASRTHSAYASGRCGPTTKAGRRSPARTGWLAGSAEPGLASADRLVLFAGCTSGTWHTVILGLTTRLGAVSAPSRTPGGSPRRRGSGSHRRPGPRTGSSRRRSGWPPGRPGPATRSG